MQAALLANQTLRLRRILPAEPIYIVNIHEEEHSGRHYSEEAEKGFNVQSQKDESRARTNDERLLRAVNQATDLDRPQTSAIKEDNRD